VFWLGRGFLSSSPKAFLHLLSLLSLSGEAFSAAQTDFDRTESEAGKDLLQKFSTGKLAWEDHFAPLLPFPQGRKLFGPNSKFSPGILSRAEQSTTGIG